MNKQWQNFYPQMNYSFKGLVDPEMNTMSLMTHPHVVTSPYDLRSSSDHSLRYFRFSPRAFCPSIENECTVY